MASASSLPGNIYPQGLCAVERACVLAAIEGAEMAAAGGVAQNVTFAGGTLELASGGSLNEIVSRAAASCSTHRRASTDWLRASASPIKIDLRDLAFVAATTKTGRQSLPSLTEAASNLSGTFTVTDGVHTASIQLLGQYTASEFATASDGHGGTLITFTSATSTTGGHGHGNAIASPVTF
jgi:hypothetical protein